MEMEATNCCMFCCKTYAPSTGQFSDPREVLKILERHFQTSLSLLTLKLVDESRSRLGHGDLSQEEHENIQGHHNDEVDEDKLVSGMDPCEKCSEIVKCICDLYKELECVALKLQWRIDNLLDTVKGSEDNVVALRSFCDLYDSNRKQKFKRVTNFRQELIRKCSIKSKDRDLNNIKTEPCDIEDVSVADNSDCGSPFQGLDLLSVSSTATPGKKTRKIVWKWRESDSDKNQIQGQSQAFDGGDGDASPVEDSEPELNFELSKVSRNNEKKSSCSFCGEMCRGNKSALIKYPSQCRHYKRQSKRQHQRQRQSPTNMKSKSISIINKHQKQKTNLKTSDVDAEFTCQECGKSFDSNYKFTRHKKTHLPVESREFACDLCEKRFNAREHLLRHALVHSGEKAFECRHCHTKFRQNHGLKKHLKTQHADLG